MFCKKGVLRHFAKKHLCQRLFLMFSCEFCEISKNTFFTEHLWTNDSISPLATSFFTLELIIWIRRNISNDHKMCINIYLMKSRRLNKIYYTCLIKPKYAQHPRIPSFAKVHVLLVENFYAAPNKDQVYISEKLIRFSKRMWQRLSQKSKTYVTRGTNFQNS